MPAKISSYIRATRDGVSRRPPRSGSSPMPSRIMADALLDLRAVEALADHGRMLQALRARSCHRRAARVRPRPAGRHAPRSRPDRQDQRADHDQRSRTPRRSSRATGGIGTRRAPSSSGASLLRFRLRRPACGYAAATPRTAMFPVGPGRDPRGARPGRHRPPQVVGAPAIDVAQDLVRAAHLREQRGGPAVLRVRVGVEAARQHAVRVVDLGRGRRAVPRPRTA